jgi:peroxiredoxin
VSARRFSRAHLVAWTLGLTLLLSAAAHAQKMPTLGPTQGLRAGNLAFDFTGKDLDGKIYHLKDLRGQVVQIVFWATWCVPCVEEIPTMRAIDAKYRDRGLVLLAVVVPTEQTKTGVREFAAKNKLGYPILWDGADAIVDRYRIDAIPQIFLVGRDGVIRFAGAELPERYDALIESALAEDVPPRAAAR